MTLTGVEIKWEIDEITILNIKFHDPIVGLISFLVCLVYKYIRNEGYRISNIYNCFILYHKRLCMN